MARLLMVAALMFAACQSAQALVVLQYHHISDTTPPSTSTTPEQFSAHLAFLAEHKFQIWSLPQLAQALRKGEPLPDKTAVITFDDGYISVFETAFPQLKERGWPFAVFINTDPHDEKLSSYMSWAQLREISDSGAAIANHTVDHAHLTERLPGETSSQWLQRIGGNIQRAEERIEQELNQNHKFLAYPYGEFNAPLKDWLRHQGYLAFAQNSAALSGDGDLQALPRFPLGGIYAESQFSIKMLSLPLPVISMTRQDERGVALADGVLSGDQLRPQLLITLDAALPALTCFASGQGVIPVKIDHKEKVNTYTVQAEKALPSGRSRYNCTAKHSESGRFYWYSQPWLRQ